MRSWQLFEAGIAPFDKNDIPADSWDYAGESAKNRFLIYQPIAEKFAYLCTKIDEISWVLFHFCNASQFSAKWHIETSKAPKSKNHSFEWFYHGKADKFDQKV